MAGDGDDNVNEAEQAFRYTNLVFAVAAQQQTYEHYQRQNTNNQTTYTRFINDSIRDITSTTKKTPINDALSKMVETQKDYIIKESNSKLEKATKNNHNFVTFVSQHDFNADQIQGFKAFIDAQNAAALKKHMDSYMRFPISLKKSYLKQTPAPKAATLLPNM